MTGRRPAVRSPDPGFDLRIGELVIEGFPASEARAIGAALEQELGQILADGPRTLRRSAIRPRGRPCCGPPAGRGDRDAPAGHFAARCRPGGGARDRPPAADALDRARSGAGAQGRDVSGAAAKIEAAPARSSSRPRQPTRVHDNGGTRGWKPAAVSGSPRIGRPDDFYEAQADRAAHQALTGAVGGPVRHAAAAPLPAPHLDAAAGGLPARIAAAGAEGRALPDAQRDFFEPRFGHRFDGVRVHSGPAAAAAASAAGAQAFTLGRSIYFGEGQYRPDSSSGRELLAHELAHTLQDRPNVVARRALNTTFDLPESDPAAEAGPEPSTGTNLDDLATLTEAGPARGNTAARDRLAQLDPAARSDAMAALRRRLPASELGKTDALGEGVQESQAQDTPAPNQMPEIRAGEAPPAPVTEDKGATPQTAAPTHQRAESAAAAKMQEAVKSMTAEVPLDGAAAQPPGSLDTSDVPAAGGGAGMAPANAAPSAAQNVVAMLGAGLAELEAAENLPVRFREETGGPPGDPEAFARITASQSLASGVRQRHGGQDPGGHVGGIGGSGPADDRARRRPPGGRGASRGARRRSEGRCRSRTQADPRAVIACPRRDRGAPRRRRSRRRP